MSLLEQLEIGQIGAAQWYAQSDEVGSFEKVIDDLRRPNKVLTSSSVIPWVSCGEMRLQEREIENGRVMGLVGQ